MIDHLKKPKHESDEAVSRFDSLLTFIGVRPTHFHFVVNAPIETCVTRLKSMDRYQSYLDPFTGRPRIEVMVLQDDDVTVMGQIRAHHPPFPWILIVVHLEQQSDNSTLVMGTATPQLLTWRMGLVIIGLAGAFLKGGLPFFSQAAFGGLAVVILGGYFILAALDTRGFISYMQEIVTFGRYLPGRRKKK